MKLIIYGAGILGKRTFKVLHSFGIEVECFVDKNLDKQSRQYCGKDVLSMNELLNRSWKETYFIIAVSTKYYSQVDEYLLECGIQKNQILILEQILLEYYEKNPMQGIVGKGNHIEESFVFDTGDCANIGGVETLVCSFTRELKDRGKKVHFVFSGDIENIPEDIRECVIPYRFITVKEEDSYEQIPDKVKHMVKRMVDMRPCKIYLSHINFIFIAAKIAKQLYSEDIQIISMVHSCDIHTISVNGLLADELDRIICVNAYIKKMLQELYPSVHGKVESLDSPVFYDNEFSRDYSNSKKPLVLGYGGRIVILQKRSNLIIDLLDHLESMMIDYRLYIAGDGPYMQQLIQEVNSRQLNNKVKLLGVLTQKQMIYFWEQTDIFINVSDYEGLSISMLEAMSTGAVPVVTDVDGIHEAVENGFNGYITPINDIRAMAVRIEELGYHREKLMKMSKNARETIQKRGSLSEYIDQLVR